MATRVGGINGVHANQPPTRRPSCESDEWQIMWVSKGPTRMVAVTCEESHVVNRDYWQAFVPP